jgi:hypothetical protein
MESKYDIVIITTAVNRSDLHKETFSKYLKFISNLKCYWLINIDQLEVDESVDDTKLKILEICQSENLTIKIKTNQSGGSREHFYKSCQYLIGKAEKIKPKYGYLWLEDDWNYQGNITLFDILQSNEFGPMDYIQLVERNHEVSFNPGLWGVDLFNKLCIPILEKPFCPHTCNNPERACVYPIDIVHNMVNKFIHNEMFTDAGRDWAAKKDMWRTFQKNIKQ